MEDLDEQIGADIVAKVWYIFYYTSSLSYLHIFLLLLILLCSECSKIIFM